MVYLNEKRRVAHHRFYSSAVKADPSKVNTVSIGGATANVYQVVNKQLTLRMINILGGVVSGAGNVQVSCWDRNNDDTSSLADVEPRLRVHVSDWGIIDNINVSFSKGLQVAIVEVSRDLETGTLVNDYGTFFYS